LKPIVENTTNLSTLEVMAILEEASIDPLAASSFKD
jgi:hypothetical protein